MPTLTRWFLRAAMLYLVAALGLGIFMALPGSPVMFGPWFAPYIHLLVLGWATQMIFGVAMWMFPRKKPLDLIATPWLEWLCFWTLNAGLVLRAVAEPVVAQRRSEAAADALIVSAALQLVAVLAFVVLVWPRVTSGARGAAPGSAGGGR